MTDKMNKTYSILTRIERLSYSVLEHFSANNYEKGNLLFVGVLSDLQKLFAEWNKDWEEENNLKLDINFLFHILKKLLRMQESRDYFGMQQILSDQLMPLVEQYIRELNSVSDFAYCPCYEKNMMYLQEHDKSLYLKLLEQSSNLSMATIEYATDGNSTILLHDELGDYYLHGRKSPFIEEINAMRNYIDKTTQKYNVLGLGLGYHIIQLSLLSDATVIDVYESSLEMIYCMIRFQAIWNLEQFSANKVRIHYDPLFADFSKAMRNSNETIVIHYPSLRHIQNEKVKREFQNYFIRDNSYRQASIKLYHNFIYNVNHINHYVDELKTKIENQTVFILAAGPSLDRNLELLSRHPKNAVVIATGTVLKKCYKNGICVDFGIFLDAKDAIRNQIDGIGEWEIPFMVASSASHYVAEEKGKEKYLVCQSGFSPAEEYASRNGYQLYESGGSVSTLAFDIAIKLKAKKIVCVGLDLAYTDNYAHAVDTSNQMIPEKSELFLQDGFWQEQKVMVDNKFDIYRKWFIRRIKENRDVRDNIEFVNATEGGAYIEGMKHSMLKDVIKSLE